MFSYLIFFLATLLTFQIVYTHFHQSGDLPALIIFLIAAFADSSETEAIFSGTELNNKS